MLDDQRASTRFGTTFRTAAESDRCAVTVDESFIIKDSPGLPAELHAIALYVEGSVSFAWAAADPPPVSQPHREIPDDRHRHVGTSGNWFAWWLVRQLVAFQLSFLIYVRF